MKTPWTQVDIYDGYDAIEATSEKGKTLLREYRDLGTMKMAYPCTRAEFEACTDLDEMKCIAPNEIDFTGLD